MKVTNPLIFFIAFICLSLTAHAQKNMYEGVLHYKVSGFDGLADDSATHSMMKSMSTTLTFKGHLFRTDVNMGLQMITKIEDVNKGIIFLLIDMGNRKLAIQTNRDEIKENDVNRNYSVYETKETTKILGYKCNKSILKFEDGSSSTIFSTKKVSFKNKEYKGEFDKIDGVVLGFQELTPMGKLTYAIENIEIKPIDDDIFVLPKEYEVMTMDQMNNMMLNLGSGNDY